MSGDTIHVVGGGLVGTLTAIFLAKRDYKVELYERRGDMRTEKVDAGRSINLVVTPRGLQALDNVGLKDKILELAVPLKGRMLHDEKGEQTFVPYGQKEGEVINAVSRGLLNQCLLSEADSFENINLYFNAKCTSYDIDDKRIIFEDGKVVEAEVTIATDGAFSAIRHSLFNNLMNFNYSQDFLDCGYKELVIAPDKEGRSVMQSDSLHIWPRGDYMLIGIPNIDGSFTCTLFFPYKGDPSFDTLKTKEDVKTFFEDVFPDAVPLMPTYLDDFFDNPTGSLATIKCLPWHIGGQLMMLGDASHAIVPFYGQGMNSGFEDCSALGNILDSGLTDWGVIFQKLEDERKINTDAIADMAVENFVEMRDTTADPKFQLKKRVGFELENRFGTKFIPRYSMVMFHPEIPFSEAQRLGEAQDKMLDKLCANINSPEDLDWDMAEKLIEKIA